jgi:hypothetical protein
MPSLLKNGDIFTLKMFFMYRTIHLFLLLLCFPLSAFCQLTLERAGNKQTKKISFKHEITLDYPTESFQSKANCTCFQKYTGYLISATKDSLVMSVISDSREYTDSNGIQRAVKQKYGSAEGKKFLLTLDTKSLKSISYRHKGRKGLGGAGGVMMLLASANQLFVSPFISPEARKTSDKITLTTFGVGLAFAIMNYSKTYYFQQPKEGEEEIWRISEQ